MAKYLVQGNYTAKGLEGLLREGGSSRKEAVGKAIESLGGTMESFYFAFGDIDVLGVVDLPDNISAATFALRISSAGGASVKTTVLMTPEEVDKATKNTTNYRAPGQ